MSPESAGWPWGAEGHVEAEPKTWTVPKAGFKAQEDAHSVHLSERLLEGGTRGAKRDQAGGRHETCCHCQDLRSPEAPGTMRRPQADSRRA